MLAYTQKSFELTAVLSASDTGHYIWLSKHRLNTFEPFLEQSIISLVIWFFKNNIMLTQYKMHWGPHWQTAYLSDISNPNPVSMFLCETAFY